MKNTTACFFQGRYGKQCERVCECMNGGTCDQVSGDCVCMPGWRGRLCEEGKESKNWTGEPFPLKIIRLCHPLYLEQSDLCQKIFILCYFSAYLWTVLPRESVCL